MAGLGQRALRLRRAFLLQGRIFRDGYSAHRLQDPTLFTPPTLDLNRRGRRPLF